MYAILKSQRDVLFQNILVLKVEHIYSKNHDGVLWEEKTEQN